MQPISTDDAPEAIGPYSQAIQQDDTVYVSGQGPVDAETGELIGSNPGEQTAQVIENISTILEAAEYSLADIVEATVYLQEMDYYEQVNEAYADHIPEPYPARAAVEVANLPLEGMHVEISVVAAD